MRRGAYLLLVMFIMGIISGCTPSETSDTTYVIPVSSASSVTSQVTDQTPVSSDITEEIIETTPEATPEITPEPTPEPQYIEPSSDEPVWYNGFVDPYTVRAEIISDPDDILALVNKYYAVPEDYVPSDLVTAPHSYDQKLRSECNDAWVKMYDDCYEATGQGLLLVSGWRDLWTQQYLFDRSKNKNGYAFACMKNALPQRSEHHLGLALDITPAYLDNITDDFASTTVGMWVNEHCYEYGFILRYQAQYTDETGYGIEAWHYRYVGVEVATYLYENDMSLEAYLGKAQVLPDDE